MSTAPWSRLARQGMRSRKCLIGEPRRPDGIRHLGRQPSRSPPPFASLGLVYRGTRRSPKHHVWLPPSQRRSHFFFLPRVERGQGDFSGAIGPVIPSVADAKSRKSPDFLPAVGEEDQLSDGSHCGPGVVKPVGSPSAPIALSLRPREI